jgi:hypothetical protein
LNLHRENLSTGISTAEARSAEFRIPETLRIFGGCQFKDRGSWLAQNAALRFGVIH